MPSYETEKQQERYNETLLKKTELAMEENRDGLKKINIT